MPIKSAETYICSHCGVRVTVLHGEEPKPWLRDQDGRQMRQDSREPAPWLLKIGEDGGEDLCPKCAEHFRKYLFPMIDDAGSLLGPVTRVKIRAADLLHALADEWDDQIESWPVESADFDLEEARTALEVKEEEGNGENGDDDEEGL